MAIASICLGTAWFSSAAVLGNVEDAEVKGGSYKRIWVRQYEYEQHCILNQSAYHSDIYEHHLNEYWHTSLPLATSAKNEADRFCHRIGLERLIGW